jgi:hypothetical protein
MTRSLAETFRQLDNHTGLRELHETWKQAHITSTPHLRELQLTIKPVNDLPQLQELRENMKAISAAVSFHLPKSA